MPLDMQIVDKSAKNKILNHNIFLFLNILVFLYLKCLLYNGITSYLLFIDAKTYITI